MKKSFVFCISISRAWLILLVYISFGVAVSEAVISRLAPRRTADGKTLSEEQ
jgi:hypothetical protein